MTVSNIIIASAISAFSAFATHLYLGDKASFTRQSLTATAVSAILSMFTFFVILR